MDHNGYIKEAKEFINFAKKKLERAEKTNDFVLSRQVCEKGYLALLKIINASFVKSGVKEKELPKTERGIRFFLRKYADKKFREKYSRLRHDLHIDGFHEGILEFDEIRECLQDLERLIKVVEE